jgi:hypothetical protein
LAVLLLTGTCCGSCADPYAAGAVCFLFILASIICCLLLTIADESQAQCTHAQGVLLLAGCCQQLLKLSCADVLLLTVGAKSLVLLHLLLLLLLLLLYLLYLLLLFLLLLEAGCKLLCLLLCCVLLAATVLCRPAVQAR